MAVYLYFPFKHTPIADCDRRFVCHKRKKRQKSKVVLLDSLFQLDQWRRSLAPFFLLSSIHSCLCCPFSFPFPFPFAWPCSAFFLSFFLFSIQFTLSFSFAFSLVVLLHFPLLVFVIPSSYSTSSPSIHTHFYSCFAPSFVFSFHRFETQALLPRQKQQPVVLTTTYRFFICLCVLAIVVSFSPGSHLAGRVNLLLNTNAGLTARSRNLLYQHD